MNSLGEREQFEEFRGGDLERCASGEYRKWSVENDWMLWQAAYASAVKTLMSMNYGRTDPMVDQTSSAVAIVCDGWDIRFVGNGPISSIVDNHNVQIGTKLVTQERLLAALERAAKAESALQNLAVEMERFRAKWRTISIEEFGYFADMASKYNLGHGPKGLRDEERR